MSEFLWTEDQTRAMDLRGKNILVSAAAGSGKTALLTERLKRLILEDGVNCQNLLVLTFTKAAASEMKQRFKRKLFEALRKRELGNLTEQEISNQITALTDSQISTIDSFAQSMVRRYFEILGIDPGFRIAEENEINLLVEEITNEVFENLFQQNEESPTNETKAFIELINLFGGELNNDELKEAIKSLNHFFDTLANPDEWVNYFTEEINNLTKENLFEFKSLQPLIKNINEVTERATENYKAIETFYNKLPWGKKSSSKGYLEDELNAVEELTDSKNIYDKIKILKNFPFKKGFRFPAEKNKTEETLELIQNAKVLRGSSSFGLIRDIKKLQNKLNNIQIEEEIVVIKELGRIFLNLVKLTKLINTKVDKEKKTRRILYFNDLERYLLKLLENDEVRDSIQREFQYIYLDEVQDTNGIQEAIIQKIETGDNRFMVGDVKQSIYRFRSADPNIIINNYQNYKNDADSELVLLNQNFRSSPEVINAVNSVFEKIMSKELGEIDYNEEAKLIPARMEHTKKAEIDLIVGESSNYSSLELQARYIAQKIQYLVSSGQVEYKDIGVLFRSINKKASILLNIFAQEGVPVLFLGDHQQIDTIEISLFLKLLSLIDNHKQDIPLAAIMELPLFNFTSDDLAKVRTAYPEEIHFYESVEKYRDLQSDLLSEKLRVFYNQLNNWRNQSKLIEMDEFLWELLLDSGFYNYFGNLNNGKERKENLRLLVEKAKDYKESSLKGITSFLQYVADLEKNGQSLSITGSSADSDNVVQLMSIHKSKGLEFKVVIFADLNSRFNINNKGPFYLSSEYGFGAQLPYFENDLFIRRDNILNDSLAIVNRKESLSEEMRLLYVAMTRARDQLYLVASLKTINSDEKWKREITPNTLLGMSTPIDWIMNSIYIDKSFQPIQDKGFLTNDWNIRIIPAEDVVSGEVSLNEDEMVEDEDYLKLREQVFNQMNKPFKSVQYLKPLKMSVSRIKHHSIAQEEPIELIPIEKEDNGFSGSEIGTATHKIMQRLDLNKLSINPNNKLILEKEIQRIVDEGFISEKLSKVVNRESILKFFNSDLGNRYLYSFIKDEDNVLKENPFFYDTNKDNELGLDLNRPIELSGIIDVSFLEDNKWVIVDYKTDHIYSKEQFEQRIKEYSTQINLYAKALEDLTKIPVKEKHLYFLRENKDVLI